MKQVLIAPQEFKGTLTAGEVAESMRRGARRAIGGAAFDLAPLADGGPGTMQALRQALGARLRTVPCRDALRRPAEAQIALFGDKRESV